MFHLTMTTCKFYMKPLEAIVDCAVNVQYSLINQNISMLTSTSAAPGSLLKHIVMVFRAILKKLVKDTDLPCNKGT